MGIAEFAARRYEDPIKAGHILISVSTETCEETISAKDIFERAGAQEICTTDEASAREHSATEHRSPPRLPCSHARL